MKVAEVLGVLEKYAEYYDLLYQDKNYEQECDFIEHIFAKYSPNEEIQKTLANVRRCLNSEALFLFDFWNGLAVLRSLPQVRVKIVPGEGKRVVRFMDPELDTFRHLCKSHYHLIVTQGKTIIDEIRETHLVRYFFPQEIIHYLREASFEVLKICPFLDLEGKVDEKGWNAMAIARAR